MKKEIDLDLIRRVTDNYFFWQGYRWVPFGIVFLMYSIVFLEPGWLPRTEWVTLGIPAFVLALSMFANSRIGQYYYEHFGRVRGIPGRHTARDTIKWLIFYPALGVGMVLDYKLKGPVFISGLAAAVCLIGYWWSTGRGREHYLFGAAVMALSSLLPTFHIVTGWKQLSAIFFGVFGLIYVVGGILDHRALTQVFAQPYDNEKDGESI